jgi:antitoxin (DNA-binding transcriptional repressor) of toxin-antitoxin stability system
MENTRVGIREFRENLSRFLESSKPVAITRHGETVGFYIPAKRKRKQADLDALLAAGEQLDAMLAAAGVTEDELVRDFKELRRQAHRTERWRVIVLDANILVRAVLGSRVWTLIATYSATADFSAPDFAFDEARRHLPTILAKRGLPGEPRSACSLNSWTA